MSDTQQSRATLSRNTTDNYVVVCVTRNHACLAIVCRWKTDSCLGNFVEQPSCVYCDDWKPPCVGLMLNETALLEARRALR